MIDNKGRQYHIHCKKGDIGRYVLLPGDPARSEKIASHFDEPRKIAANREFVTYSGRVNGELVSVTSTGIGGPSTAIAVDELSELGADTFIRVGGGGGMQPHIMPGDTVIASGAVRDDGSSNWLIPPEYPAVASYEIVSAMVSAAKDLRKRFHVGITHSKATFYGQEHERERAPAFAALDERWHTWIRGGVIASEMEAATIFVIAATKGLRSGCVLTVGGDLSGASKDAGGIPSVYSKEESIAVAIRAIEILSEWDRSES